jgi:peptidoglycan/LPS O-acetylase OafA/YrhL
LVLSLATAAENRVNNFRIIRLIAATSVIFSHALPLNVGIAAALAYSKLTTIRGLSGLTYGTCGEIAVDVFFGASGFLVAHSLLTRNDVVDYIMARVLRITPGLVVMSLACAFLLGPAMTTLGVRDYLHQPSVYTFVALDSLAVSPWHVQQQLPGVFEHTPNPMVVNGSLWTLPWEIWMYVSLLGLFLVRLTGKLFPIVLTAILAIYGLSCFDLWVTSPMGNAAARLAAFFYCGVALYRFRHHVLISGRWALAFSAVFLGGTLILQNSVLLAPYVVYMTLFAAYWPPIVIKRWSEGDDISYGMYIYAYPIQQSLVFILGPHNAIVNCLLTVVIAAVPAFASWRLVERPALRLRSVLRQRIGLHRIEFRSRPTSFNLAVSSEQSVSRQNQGSSSADYPANRAAAIKAVSK